MKLQPFATLLVRAIAVLVILSAVRSLAYVPSLLRTYRLSASDFSSISEPQTTSPTAAESQRRAKDRLQALRQNSASFARYQLGVTLLTIVVEGGLGWLLLAKSKAFGQYLCKGLEDPLKKDNAVERTGPHNNARGSP